MKQSLTIKPDAALGAAVVDAIAELNVYAVRSGVESTVNEFAHGHGMRRCRYRGQGKAHIQHILTAIAVNIERLSGLPPAEEAPTPRRPTAFQNYLDQREVPRLKSWRTLGS
ncbi:transposase [Streptomyces europaeiscabiei]|uniref:transposase n=1 Tax=Streptomyces europaeiscabiei TaxID=146819 RepID=UPI0039907D6D